MIIYKVTNLVNGKVYIGQTVREFEIRKTQHIYDTISNKDNSIFHKALLKYGQDKFQWEIIDNAETEEELNKKEIYWINFYNSYIRAKNSNGYNMTIGGEGMSGYKHSDESKEKISKVKKGSKHHNAKLTEEDVLQIKELIKSGAKPTEISQNFKVNIATICDIKSGKKWNHIGEDVSYIKYSTIKSSKLSEEDVIEIKLLLKQMMTSQKEIAKMFNVSESRINQINLGKAWKHVVVN
jgi:group I intron endonuclease